MTRLKRQFHSFNFRFFGSRLDPDTIVVWSSSLQRGVAGEYDPSGCIRIASALRPFDSVWKETLLHEMAHLATETETAEHGPQWQAEMRRLYRLGAFTTLW